MYIIEDQTLIDERFRIVGDPAHMGGQSICYQARDERSALPAGVDVFIKQYHDLSVVNIARAVMFFRELEKRLRDAKHLICLPMDADPDNTDPDRYQPAISEAGRAVYTAFPWVHGTTLEQALKTGLPEAVRIRVAEALIEALDLLGQQQVAHLDLKPANIMVHHTPQTGTKIQLVDLDASRIGGEGIRSIMGTIQYMSPEHMVETGESPDCRSDIFTLGILLSRLLYHHHPFADMPDYRTAIKRGLFNLPSSNDYHQDIPNLISRCLSPTAMNRPRIQEIIDKFRRLKETGLKYVRGCIVISDATTTHRYFESQMLDYYNMRVFDLKLPRESFFRLEVEEGKGYYSLSLVNQGIDARFNQARMVGQQKMYISEKPAMLEVNGQVLLIWLERVQSATPGIGPPRRYNVHA